MNAPVLCTVPRWLAALVVAATALLLSGCADLPWRKPADTAAASAERPEALRDMFRLQVEAPDELQGLLNQYLDLGRFQRGPASDTITAPELDRLIAAAPLQARGLVETQGYFNAEVDARRLPLAEGELPVVQVTVRPGARTRIERVTLEAAGALKDALDRRDAKAQRTLAELRAQWALPAGAPFRQSAWSDAKAGTLTALRADGYPSADWQDTSARVDASANTASLYALFDSGPLFRLGELRIEGLSRYGDAAVRNLATFPPGAPYTEKALLDTQERLVRSGLFEGAVVTIDPDPATAAAAPVLVRVKEQPLQQATIGLGYSDQSGQRISFEHTHRRLFGRSLLGNDWISKNKLEWARDKQSWEGEVISHPLPGGWHHLLGGAASREDAAGTVVRALGLRVGRAVESERVDRRVYAEWLTASTSSGSVRESSRAATGNYNAVWRRVDSILLPTRGWTASAETALGYAWSGSAPNGAFGRVLGRFTWYRPLGQSWYANARVQLGHVAARAAVAIPDTLLFRAGGDDSVRGYAYRSLGPLQSGVVTSGRVLLTTSAEIARPISARLPDFWWALFADAGNAAERWGDLRPVLGYGAGLRWRSPVGPLRLDLAYADELRKSRIHLSVGITF
jgi:translocation and assembly module TamA